MRIAILDDYQDVALRLADWSDVRRHAEIVVFNDHVSEPSAVIERLRPFDVVCVMRERTPVCTENPIRIYQVTEPAKLAQWQR